MLIVASHGRNPCPPPPQPLVPVLSKGKLLNNNILILKTDFFQG